MKLLIMGIVLFFLGIFAFLLFSLGSRPDWLSEYFILIFGGMLALVISIIAYWWRARWWFAYAAVLFVG